MPANFAALQRHAQTSHSVAHARELQIPTIPRDTLLAEHSAHEAQLTTTITDLRRRIIDEELALSNLQPPPTDPLRRLHALRAAHDEGFATIDYIPDAASPLNELLAFRSVQSVITRTTASLDVVTDHLTAAQSRLKAEEKAETEQNQLSTALESRLRTLEDAPSDDADLVREMQRRKQELAKKTAALLRELLYFLGAGLARMLAAEEMGGPVVGADLEVTLDTGFDKMGKVRKGERRIDEMWGAEGPEKRIEREFRDLLEELMNASLETDPYVQLKKDTAIARFLVRAKVAVFHPKDARRLRLVDFGRSVEDG